MKKLLTLLLTFALVCCMLASCASPTRQIIAKADLALTEAPYKMMVYMDFECDNKAANEIFATMDVKVPIIIDGNNLSMNMKMSVKGNSASVKTTIVDKVIYCDASTIGQSIKLKATMSDEEYYEFLNENNTQMILTPFHFENITIETKDDKQYITCTEIYSDGLEELNDLIAEALASINGKATIDDVSYVLVLKDGKYKSMDISYTYTVSANNESFAVTVNIDTDFSYDNIASITAPADADKYKDVDFGDLFG